MIKVAALTSGKNVPSARFRIRQHIEPLMRLGIDVKEYPSPISKTVRLSAAHGFIRQYYVALLNAGLVALKFATRMPGVIRSRQADVVWLNRELVAGFCGLESILIRPRLFDVDDAIWINRPYVKMIAKNVDVVIAGNSFLADWFSDHCDVVHVVPTAIDTKRFVPANLISKEDSFIIGWTGSYDNLHYIYDIEKILACFLRDHPLSRICVLCDKQPMFSYIPTDRVDFIKWSPENESVTLQSFDVGLMPLRDTDWNEENVVLRCCSIWQQEFLFAFLRWG